MLITKHFHDYYDGVCSLGVDKSIVYNRVPYQIHMEATDPSWVSTSKPETAEPFHLWKPFIKLKEIYKYVSQQGMSINSSERFLTRGWMRLTAKSKEYDSVSVFVVIACGKPYIGYRVYCNRFSLKQAPEEKYFYDLDKVLDFLEVDRTKEVKELVTPAHYKSSPIMKKIEKRQKKLIEFLSRFDYDDISREIKSPVIAINTVRGIEINPRLAEVNFATCVDPMTMFQEIQMYHSTISGLEDPNMVQVSDETKRDSHGFHDYSFKTRKGSK